MLTRLFSAKRWCLAVAAWLCLNASSVFAVADPRQMLEQTSDEMIAALKAEQAQIRNDPERLFDLVSEVLVPHVDLERMSRWVLGRYWRQATPEQQTRFTEEFRKLLVRFYVSALLDEPNELDRLLAASDGLITFYPATSAGENRAQVRADVRLPEGQTVPVLFSMLEEGGQWKIYDVNIEGISLVNNYRTTFASQIRRSGIADLIDRLEQRNQELLQQARHTP